MESSQRGALALVRLVAACVIILGLLDAGMYLTEYLIPYSELHQHAQGQRPPPLSIIRLVLDSIPVIVGIALFVRAKAIAEWLSDLIQ